MTNYEKIKAMSVEEMAKWVENIIVDCGINICPARKLCDEEHKDYLTPCRSCFEILKTWLGSEVEEDG